MLGNTKVRVDSMGSARQSRQEEPPSKKGLHDRSPSPSLNCDCPLRRIQQASKERAVALQGEPQILR